MNLRIDKKHTDKTTILQINGELSGRGILELKRICQETSGPLSLDLTNMVYSDPDGLKLLQSLTAQGIKPMGMPPHIKLIINSQGNSSF